MSRESDAHFLDIDQVREKPGGSRKPDRATIWRWVKNDPEFPKPVRVGPNMVRWIEAEIDEFFARKIARRDDPRAQESDRALVDKRRSGQAAA
jgi:prophage regulatory protein